MGVDLAARVRIGGLWAATWRSGGSARGSLRPVASSTFVGGWGWRSCTGLWVPVRRFRHVTSIRPRAVLLAGTSTYPRQWHLSPIAGGVLTSAPTSPSTARLLTPANTHFSDNGRRGRYGVAYLRALCATAGVGLKENSADEDVDAIDATLRFARASAEVQVKCTSGFKVGVGRATLQLEPDWVAKWSASYHPVFIILVKVPVGIDEWIDFKQTSTAHRTVAFGKRFDRAVHGTSMQFTKADRLTAETLYDWRDAVDAHHEHGVGGAA